MKCNLGFPCWLFHCLWMEPALRGWRSRVPEQGGSRSYCSLPKATLSREDSATVKADFSLLRMSWTRLRGDLPATAFILGKNGPSV